MPTYKFTCSFSAAVDGSYTGNIDINESTKGRTAILEEAEEAISGEIEEALNNAGDSGFSVDRVSDISIEELERDVCVNCNGKGFTLVTLDEGAGLMKAGPCTRCQRVPTTKDACEAVIEAIAKLEEAEED